MGFEMDQCHLNFSFSSSFKRKKWILGFGNRHGMVGDQFPLAGYQRVGSHEVVGGGFWPPVYHRKAAHHGGLAE